MKNLAHAPLLRPNPERQGNAYVGQFLFCLLLLSYLVIPPVLSLLQTSLASASEVGKGYTLANFTGILNGDLLGKPLWNTVSFAVGSSLVALLIGGLTALIVERTDSPFRYLGTLTAMFSFGVPYILYSIAWLLLLGKAGPVNALLMGLFSLEAPLINIYSLSGMILVEGFLWSPLVFLMIGAIFKAMDPSLEEAALMSGAGLWGTLSRITARLVLPGVLSVAMLVFIRAFESFEIPALVGLPGEVYVLTTRIYIATRSLPPDYGQASAFAVILLLPVAFFLYFYNRMTREARRFQTVTGKGFRPRLLELGKWNLAAGAWLIFYFLLTFLLPVLMLIYTSLLPYYKRPSLEMLERLTLQNFEKAFGYPRLLDSMQNTVILGILAATVLMLLTFLAAWLTVRTRARGRQVVDSLATAPLVFPGIVLGLAIMRFYLQSPLPVYGTIWILGIAYITRYLPYGMRNCSAGFLQIHQELEEAASISGASWWAIMRLVLFPLLKPAFWAGWIFIFLLVMKELSISVLLAGPKSPVIAVSIFDLWQNGQSTELAAFGLVWFAFLGILSMVFYKLSRGGGTALTR